MSTSVSRGCQTAADTPMTLDAGSILYLSEADVERLALPPALVRQAIEDVLASHHAGHVLSKPKVPLALEPGRAFQMLAAASNDSGWAASKWIGIVPPAAMPGASNINATLLLSDTRSGRLVSVMGAGIATGLRTAAMSAAAARLLARPDSRTIGFVGCGTQARYHLPAMMSVLPGLRRLIATSRTGHSAERLAASGRAQGLEADACDDTEAVIRRSDVVVTSVPLTRGFAPFLDPDWIAPGAFVAAVDIARSWHGAGLQRLDLLAVDDDALRTYAPAGAGPLPPLATAYASLGELIVGAKPRRQSGSQRAMLVSSGVASADLAIAALIYGHARARNLGVRLPR